LANDELWTVESPNAEGFLGGVSENERKETDDDRKPEIIVVIMIYIRIYIMIVHQ